MSQDKKRIHFNILIKIVLSRMSWAVLGTYVLLLLILACSFSFAVSNTHAQSKPFKEYHIKAIFLYNLTNFVSWPDECFADPRTPLRICILGKDPFGPFLDRAVKGEKVNGRKIVLERSKNIQNLCPCHILFVSNSMEKKLPEIFEITQKKHVLTVADIKGFSHLGGIVQLICKGKRVRVEINVDSARNAGLIISSKLLKIARIVKAK